MNTDPQKSAQPCGCDEAARHVCDRHKAEINQLSWRVESMMHADAPYTFSHAAQKKLEEQARINDANDRKDLVKDGRGELSTQGQGHQGAWGGKLTTIKDSGERVAYASGSLRDPSTGKIKWSRITFGPMLRRWAQHLTTAEAKYPDHAPGVPNFTLIETDEEYLRYKESAFRHFMSWYFDETDEDHASATYFNINGVEIIKDKARASHRTLPPSPLAVVMPRGKSLLPAGELGSVLRNEEDYR